jgi:hypothetical protein
MPPQTPGGALKKARALMYHDFFSRDAGKPGLPMQMDYPCLF